MCLLLISYKKHKDYKLIVAANRDEFYNRPALPAKFWGDHPELLGGKDLQAGGTWLGITRGGRFAAITNYRDMKDIRDDVISRGNLTLEFLINNINPKTYAEKLLETSVKYNGYNLIFGDKNDLYYFSNKSEKIIKLAPGIYGLSNHLLDTPWPKVTNSKISFEKVLNEENLSAEKLFNVLSDKTISAEDSLPDTGLAPEIERAVSPVFVETPFYGTRSSTVIFWDNRNEIKFFERSLSPENKQWEQNSYSFLQTDDN